MYTEEKLKELLKNSDTFDADEKTLWLKQINEVMDEDQKERFYTILQNERDELDRIEKDYQENILKLNK